jgi:hypothetical protein
MTPVIPSAEDIRIVESRSAGTAGTWKMGGRSIEATATTNLDEDDGPAKVGSCVTVDFEGTAVEEIETEKEIKCKAQ